MMMEEFTDIATVPTHLAGQRLDKVLTELFPHYSRSRLQIWLKQGYITLDGARCQPKHKVIGAETVQMELPAEAPSDDLLAEAIDIDCVYADTDLIVINKPAGMVVHPAAGHRSGTLQNALLYHFPELAAVPRAGLVHRLDKDTTGLLVVARNLPAHRSLVEQLQARTVRRGYTAVVVGRLLAGGTVSAPIGRHPVERKRMAVRADGRPAITHYQVAAAFRCHTQLNVNLETGRTHQIRVHMAHLKKPLVGDPVYAGRLRLPPAANAELIARLQGFKRQALHAASLGIHHPKNGELMQWHAAAPEDLQALIADLQQDQAEHAG